MEKKVLVYKVELYNGPCNGGVRYYKSLSSALRAARSYVTRNRDYPEHIGFDVYGVYSDYSVKRLFSEID